MNSPVPENSAFTPGLRPPQFRLRSLLLAVALCAVLLAAARWMSPVVWAVGIFFGMVILAHVAGNAIGTELRRRNGARGQTPEPARMKCERIPSSLGSPNQMQVRASLGRPIAVATVLGGVCGAAGGCLWLRFHYGAAAEMTAFVTAVPAFATLGAFFTFATMGFLQVIIQSVRHATGTTPPIDHGANDGR